jgi:hypothetical protein
MFPLQIIKFDANTLCSGDGRVLRQSSAIDKKRCCFCYGSSLEQESGEREAVNVIRDALLPALVSITDPIGEDKREVTHDDGSLLLLLVHTIAVWMPSNAGIRTKA